MQYRLKLYVTASTEVVARQVRQIESICKDHGVTQCDLEVINVLESPAIAEAQGILATPTLVKEKPLPMRRVIGDLSDPKKIAALWF